MNTNPAARLSIVAYKPKQGKEADLLQLSHEHVPYLRSIGAATDRPHVVCTAADGTVVEVFEWAPNGLDLAHTHDGVKKMWMRYSEACDYVPLNTLQECSQVFANFVPVE